MNEHFGEHLTIDGYGGNAELLDDQNLVQQVLQQLPLELGMKPLIEPVVVLAPENNIKDPGGWSGFVVIAESHISLHTFPKRGFVSADIYTCHNGLDVEKVKSYFQETFQLKDLETNFIIRGTKYPSENLS